MAALIGLLRILTTTRNAYAVLPMIFRGRKKSITFWNGSTFLLDWRQFCYLRDNYALMQKYAFEQLDNDLFKIKSGNFEFAGTLIQVCIIGELKQKYSIKQIEDNVYGIKSEKFELIGSFNMLFCTWEIERGVYSCDCRDKVVLDVGGFEGESAVFFSGMGAKKVIIYEPIADHHMTIRKNVFLNHVNAEIHEEGIGNNDGTKTISYEEKNGSLGFLSKGQHETEIKIRDVASVIKESGASVAKFDCEGAEESLVQVRSQTLRRIELYMIEVHTPKIRKAIIKKFKASGFSLEKEMPKGSMPSVIFLRKNS